MVELSQEHFGTGKRKKRGLASHFMSITAVLLGLALVVVLAPRPITVVDGDTVDRWPWRYRLAGFDTPETRRGRYRCAAELQAGRAAAVRLEDLIARAQRAELHRTTWRLDRWGRVLARLELDGEDVAAIAIREGWGVAYHGRGPRRDWCAG